MKSTYTWVVTASLGLFLAGCGDTYNNDQDTGLETTEGVSLLSMNREVRFLTDTDGMSLYTFDKDTLNVSNCDAACQKIWPLLIGAESGSETITPITGTDQLTYRGHPLYYFVNDTVPGDINGDGVKEVWHLVYAPEDTNDSQTAFSEPVIQQTYLTDENGRALYTFDKDEANVSHCYGSCEEIWPVYYGPSVSSVPTGLSKDDFHTITRDANQSTTGVLSQTAFRGKPLYYFTPDGTVSGSTAGDWVKGVWHLIELSAVKAEETAPSPYTEAAEKLGKAVFTDPAKCSRCHGADGQTKPLGVDNVIARYGDPALIEQKLRDMRDNGNPQNRDQLMVNIAKGLSDEAITNLSAFVATLKP